MNDEWRELDDDELRDNRALLYQDLFGEPPPADWTIKDITDVTEQEMARVLRDYISNFEDAGVLKTKAQDPIWKLARRAANDPDMGRFDLLVAVWELVQGTIKEAERKGLFFCVPKLPGDDD